MIWFYGFILYIVYNIIYRRREIPHGEIPGTRD